VRLSREEIHISAKMAPRLGRYFGNGPEFWAKLQMQHDLTAAARELTRDLRKITPLTRGSGGHGGLGGGQQFQTPAQRRASVRMPVSPLNPNNAYGPGSATTATQHPGHNWRYCERPKLDYYQRVP
jgi:hypothetical protein